MRLALSRVLCLGSVSLFASAAGYAQSVLAQPLITQPINESQVIALRGNTHPLAQPQFDIGSAPGNLSMQRMLLVLKRDPQQEFALHKLLDDQQDQASPNYHKWLTPDEFGAQFGPSDQDLQLVSGWLQSHGFQVNRITHGRSVIEFSGFESQVEQAFHTQIHQYSVNGQVHWANASDPQIPVAFVPAVSGVWSLHDFRKKPRIKIFSQMLRAKYTSGIRPDTTFNTSHGVMHALSPADFATIYNINPIYSGGNLGGVDIAVVARSNLFGDGQPFCCSPGSDIYNFRGVFNIFGSGSLRIINDGPDPGDLGGGEEAEATLDATWSGAVAPNSNIDFVVSASTTTTDGVDLSELYIIDNDVAPIMTESFGSCEKFATPSEAQGISMLAEQAAAEGITYLISSGDSGAAGCDDPNDAPATQGASVNVLSSPEFTVAVGGTTFNEGTSTSKYWNSQNGSGFESARSYIPEKAWNESCLSCAFPNLFSTGGGASIFFSKPTWQSGVSGIPNDGARDVPDVALSAAIHDGYLLCLQASCVPDSQGFISFALIGGTSASAPSFAGIMALVDQAYGPQGQANYLLYPLAAAETLAQCNGSSSSTPPASSCVFNDVTNGNNSVPGQNGFSAVTGYDLATGLGSVNVTNLVNKWNSPSFHATTTTLAPNSITGTHGAPISLTVGVSTNSSNGTPTGDVALQTSLIVAPGFIDAFPPAHPGFLALNNGSATSTFNNLPGGSYTLTAQYGGDGIFAPSPPSAPVNVNISPENSRTTLSVFTADQNGNLIPFTQGPFGGFVYLRADAFSQSGQGAPTGFINLLDNGNIIGGVFLNSQGNGSTPNGYMGFSVGAHSLAAQFGGDNSFKTSMSSPVSFAVKRASTTASLQPSSSVAASGTPVTLTANISSPAFVGAPFNFCSVLPCESANNYPSGTVTFFAGNTQLGTAIVNGSGITQNGVTAVASVITSALVPGQNTITAQYTGDGNYIASSAAPIAVTVDADFSFSAASSSITITKPGGSASNTLTITGQTGYNSTINFSSGSCSGLPLRSTCQFSPVSVGGSGNLTVTITTTAPSGALRLLPLTSTGIVFAGVLMLASPFRRRRISAVVVLLVCTVALGSVSCGGGSGGGGGGSRGNPGTPTGNYNVVVTATTSDGVVSHSAGFTLVVQ